MAEKVPAVHVTVDGTTYPAGESLPDGVADLIDNPKVWGDESDKDEAPKPTAKKAAAKRSASK